MLKGRKSSQADLDRRDEEKVRREVEHLSTQAPGLSKVTRLKSLGNASTRLARLTTPISPIEWDDAEGPDKM